MGDVQPAARLHFTNSNVSDVVDGRAITALRTARTR